MKSSRDVRAQQEEPVAKRAKPARGLEITDQQDVPIVGHANYETDRFFATVGSPVRWRVRPLPAGAQVANVSWTVTGETLARCTQVLESGTAEPLTPQELSATDLSFFWITGGVHTVRVTADVDGERVETSLTVEIIAPTVRRGRITTATVNVMRDHEYLNHEGSWFALYEPEPHERFGCTWDVEVRTGIKRIGDRAFGGGSLAFIQVSGYEMVRLLELPPGKTHAHSHQRTSRGATRPTALDAEEGGITYGDVKLAGPDETVVFGPNDITYSDSPGNILARNTIREFRHDQHWLHLVYKSRAPGSIWVTLAIGAWSWQTVLVREDQDVAKDFLAPQSVVITPPSHQPTDMRLTHEPPVWDEQTSVRVKSLWTPGQPPNTT